MAAAALLPLRMPSNLITTGPNSVALFTRLLNFAVGLLELVLGLRFFLRLAGANATNAFVSFIYHFADLFLAPFKNAFPKSIVEGSVLEWSTLLAMAIYAVVGYALIQLIFILTKQTQAVTVETLDVDMLDEV